MRTIYQIDKQHNGYVTTTELDDILKLNYKDELGNKDTRLIMRKYASIQNRVLVDYKKFRDSIVQQLKMLQEIKDLPATSNSAVDEKRQRLKAVKDKHIMKLNETLNNYMKKRTQELENMNHTPRIVPQEDVPKERQTKSATRLHNLLVHPSSQEKLTFFLKETDPHNL